MEKDEFLGEINDKKTVLESLEFSTTTMLYMTEDIRTNNEIYRRVVKNNVMAIAWDVYYVCDKEKILNAIKHPKGFRFLKYTWRNDEEIASRAIQLCPENLFYTDYDCYNRKNTMV